MALIKAIVLAIAIGYLAIAVLLWLAQERLIFLPAGSRGPAVGPPGWTVEAVALNSADGTALAGALLLPPGDRHPLVIYYGGNAEEVTAYAPRVGEAYGQRAVLLVNYRGYGESRGKPGEKALVADALYAFEWAAAHPRIDPSRVAVHGRSLGSAIAVAVAAAKPVKSVVLTSPFSSAREVAAELYPWLPVGWLLRHPFDAAALAPRVRAPALVLVGEEDNIIRKHHSERLAGFWGGAVERRNFAGFGHNDLDLHPGYIQAIRAFLDRTL
jgi:uncharacterized protein